MHEGKHGILDGLEDLDDLFGSDDDEEEEDEDEKWVADPGAAAADAGKRAWIHVPESIYVLSGTLFWTLVQLWIHDNSAPFLLLMYTKIMLAIGKKWYIIYTKMN